MLVLLPLITGIQNLETHKTKDWHARVSGPFVTGYSFCHLVQKDVCNPPTCESTNLEGCLLEFE